MKKVILIFILSTGFICVSSARAENLILCIPTATTPVYDQDLKTVLFEARQFEAALPFQSFGSKDKTKISAGEKNNFIRVELIDREEEDADNNVGWINKDLLKTQSKCSHFKAPRIMTVSPETEISIQPVTQNSPLVGLSFDCCSFPFKKHPTMNYTTEQRRFGANRSGGNRVHAAADLYQSQYFPVYAIANGTVLRDRVPFYLGTCVTEIEHPGGFIARYGEIASPQIKPLKLGSTVKAGQLIGYIKKVNISSVKSAMLHFELYSGKARGPLTTRKGKYDRRSDLMNPTAYLQSWEKKLK